MFIQVSIGGNDAAVLRMDISGANHSIISAPGRADLHDKQRLEFLSGEFRICEALALGHAAIFDKCGRRRIDVSGAGELAEW